MSKPDLLIEEALLYAKEKGIHINRGGSVFDRTNNNSYPISCNAFGAILIKLGQENLVNNGFDPTWIKVICNYLNVEPYWLNRFSLGFDYAVIISITTTDCWNVDRTENDKVSLLGTKLAKKFCV